MMATRTKTSKARSSRFTRSVNVEHDLYQPDSLSGYVVTAGVRRSLMRIAPARHDRKASRVWTLTGPYGTGKSAFALYAAKLFSHAKAPGTADARRLLRSSDPDLATDVLSVSRSATSLLPIAVSGAREPLGIALLRGLQAATNGVAGRKKTALSRKIQDTQDAALAGEEMGARVLTDLFAETLDTLCDGSGQNAGVFLIIDELGKLLEHASTHSATSDVFILQSLAEFAARSEKPFLILSVLHQDFSVYGEHLSARDRAEWDKVRGRFEDIAFEEPADEILRLIAQARCQANESQDNLSFSAAAPKDGKSFQSLCESAWKLDLAPPGVTKAEFTSLLTNCWPLHPLVAVLLGQLFRKLAQNERSVFSFLESSEPHSLREYLHQQNGKVKLPYAISQLYDYLVASVGEGLYLHLHGKRWAEIETVLSRLPDASSVDIALVKTVGLLGAMGQWKNLRASRDLLRLALSPSAMTAEVNSSLKVLQKKSAIVVRKYNNSFALWEGSDVDLEQRIRDAREKIDPTQTLASLASRYMELRPLVARRHSFETGSLRYFDVRFVSSRELSDAIKQTATDSAGSLLVVLPQNADEHNSALEQAKSARAKSRVNLLIGIPDNVQPLEEAVRESACLEWVKTNTPELEGDSTGRRELRARVVALQRRIESALSSLLAPTTETQDRCEWYYKGRLHRLDTRRALNEFLSKMCEQIYSKTPRILNELINRESLSSAAAAARRNLVEAMLTNADQLDLGIGRISGLAA